MRYSKYPNPNPVNELAKAAAFGRLSRREVIKRGTALGLSSALMANILKLEATGAQGSPSPSADQPAGYSIVPPENVRTDLAGQRINVVGPATGPGEPFYQAVVDAFVEATGIETNFIRGAESATDRLSFYLQVFSAQATDIDACEIDVIWPGIMNPHAVDLKAAFDEQGVEYFERIVSNNTVDDKLVGIPFFTDAGLLYYRTDLLEQYSLQPPQTWTELEEMATTIQEGEAAGNPSFTGFVWQGAAYEGLTCNGLEWQFSNNGGTIIEEDGSVSVNNENAIAMFEKAKGWVGTISPQGVTDFMEEDARGIWQGGNSAFMRQWPGAYALGQAPDSVIKDKFDVSPLPKGDAEGAQNADTLGGWQMMVSTYSEAQEAAIEWAKFATSREIQKSQAIERALLPTIEELYQDPDVLAANPFFERLFDVFSGGAVARPSTASADLYNDVSTAYFTTLNQILSGGADDPAAAVEELEGQLEDIMSEL